jgi:anthranilate phosphoribosyltransferase
MTDFTPLATETPAEHPFAPFVRILGKGKRGARNMTRAEAREAMVMVLDEKVEDTQLGAFLMLLRHKEESPDELAGFTEAVRERLHAPELTVDIDWPTYAGKSAICRGTCWRPSAWRRTASAY